VTDLQITDEEVEHLREIDVESALKPEQIRVLHARPNFSGFSTGYLRAGRGLRGILAELVFSL